jgi:hypothetical protein
MDTLVWLLSNNTLNEFVNDYRWVWPICEMIHFVGMALLFGTIGFLDLRLLGLARGLPVAGVSRLVPWGVAGFGLCAVTGYFFVAGSVGGPIDHLTNRAFQLKSLCLLLAGLNVLVFFATGVSRAVEVVGPGETAPAAGKVVAASSLALWLAVVYFGRMIMYSDSFFDPGFYTLW